MGCGASVSQSSAVNTIHPNQPAPFPSKTLRLANDEIVEDEDDLDESDSETSVASEADDDVTSRNFNYEGLKQDHLEPVDLQMGHRPAEKDPVVYSLPARKLLIGDINDDIPENVKVVRIFTSSTFTDTSVERNTLMEQVYPKLKSFCQERGYDFQVVDMRWGIREEATDDHLMTELCMRELTTCQKLSTGPNFVTFMGQKYGYRPLQPRVAASEFERLLEAVENKEDCDVLKHWYWRDDNSVPPVYVLQPISSRLPHYNDLRDLELRQEARGKWWAAYERLHVIMRRAADKVLTKDERRKFYMSVTEEEIRRGIINYPSPAKHCFWFKRVITDLRKNTDKPKASKFIDKTQDASNIDETAQELLNFLQDEEIPQVLPNNNVIQYDISWTDNGVDPVSTREHKEYIENLCNRFYVTLCGMIQEGIEERDTLQISDPLTKEVLDHASFCLRKCKSFYGRQDFLRTIRDGLINGKGERAVVIHGESGCGKTSILAKIAKDVKRWLENQTCLAVFRFLGTSPDSSSARLLLRSICQQLCKLTGQNTANIPDDMKSLSEFFPRCMEKACAEMRVVLILDSLDQLSTEDGGRQLEWLPRNLPENLSVIMSTLPGKEFEAFPNLKTMFPEKCFVEVPRMATSEADLILRSWLKSTNRTLQQPQKDVILSAFQNCQLPLYLKLAFDEACRWKSYTPISETRVESTVKEIISALFDRLERLHGKILVSHALGYITASKNGVTEPELEDLLSLDDTVLNDVYQFWTPPIRRMLPALWFRIHADVGDYLIQRGSNGVPVVYWYHRQFIEVARDRYLNGTQGEIIHYNMSQYFLGTWADGNKKPFVNKDNEKIYMDRLVAKQPLMYQTKKERNVFNFRKLNELPHHLLKSTQLEQLKKETLCNFEFLLAKLRATSLDVVLEDFSAARNFYGDDDEIEIVEKFMRLASMALMRDPRQLAPQLIGRLQSLKDNGRHPSVGKLVKDAYNCSVPCFVPSHQCLTSPGGSLVSSIEVGDQNAVCEFSCDRKTVFVGYPTKDGVEIKVLDVRTGNLIRRVNFRWENETAFKWFLRSSEHHKDRLLLAGSKTVFLVDLQTRQVLQTYDALSEALYNFHYPVSFGSDEDVVVALTDTALKIWNTGDGNLLHSLALGQLDREAARTMDAKGKFLVYSLHGEGLHVLDVSTCEELAMIDVGEKVKEVRISALNQIVVLPASRKSVFLYDLNTRVMVKNIPEYEAYFGLYRLQLTQDGTKAISYNDAFVLVTNLQSGEVQKTPKSSLLGSRLDFANLFTRDGRQVMAVCFDKILRIYKYPPKEQTWTESDPFVNEKISGVYPGVDGRHLVTTSMGSDGQTLSVWDVPLSKIVRRLRCSNVGVNEVRLLNSTQAVAKIYIEQRKEFAFAVVDLKDGSVLRWMDGNAGHSWAMGFVKEVYFLAFSRVQRQLEIWDVSTGRLVQQRGFGRKFQLADALLSNSGDVVVFSLVQRMKKLNKSLPLIVLDTDTDGHQVLKVKGKQLTLRAASLDDKGKHLLCSTVDHTALIWDVRNPAKLLHTLKLKEVVASGFTTDLQPHAVTSHRDGTLLVVDVLTGQILHKHRSEPAHKMLISNNAVAYTFHRNQFYAWDLQKGGNIASFTVDWEPTSRHVYVIGNHVTMCLPDQSREMNLRLRIPASKEYDFSAQSPYEGVPLQGHLSVLT